MFEWERGPPDHETNHQMFWIYPYPVRGFSHYTPRYKARKYIHIQRWERRVKWGRGSKGRRFRLRMRETATIASKDVNRFALHDSTGNDNNRRIRWKSWYLLFRNNVLPNLVRGIPFPTKWLIQIERSKKTRNGHLKTDNRGTSSISETPDNQHEPKWSLDKSVNVRSS